MTVVSKRAPNATQNENHIPVPRRTVYRRLWRLFLRTVAPFMIKAEVRGRKNFPRPGDGPVIIVANHNAIIEVGMLVAYAPYPIEFLTTGDIPLEPRVAFLGNLYGFIPVKRGSMDRKAMTQALSVLEQGGVVGLFPQGGIWDTTVTQAHTGVSWLSQKGNAPIVPVGFGGTAGSLMNALKGKRPRVTMNVGEPIPPTPQKVEGKSRKQVLEDHTAQVMNAVFDLIPQWEKDTWKQLAEETFELMLEVTDSTGHSLNGRTPQITHANAVCKFFHRPVLLDAMRRNLELPVDVLEQLPTARDPQAIAAALDAVLDYITSDNPYFLTYRFGNDEGHAMEAGLTELRDVARWAHQNDQSLHLKPVRRFRMESETELTVQEYPVMAQEI